MRQVSAWIGAAVFSLWLLLLMLGLFSGATFGLAASAATPASATASTATAEKPSEKAADKASTAGVAPQAATRAADPTAAPTATQTAQPAETSQSLLQWLAGALGVRYVVIFLFLTVNLVALLVMNVLAVWRDNVIPLALVQGVQAHLAEKHAQEACELIKSDSSFLGRVLSVGVSRLPAGCDAAIAAMEETGSYETMKMEQRLGYVALIAQIAPLVGLLGTVDGLLAAFEVIAHKDVSSRPSDLAAGIGTALVATIVGLWIAIPAVAFYHIVRNRMNRLVAEVGIVGEDLIRRLAATNKKP
jgi:biopolymer transport protein ExbB